MKYLTNIQSHYIFCLLLCFYGLSDTVYAQTSPLLLTKDRSYIDLKSYAEILEDPTGELTLAEVIKIPERFSPIAKETIEKYEPLEMGLTCSSFWLKIDVINQSDDLDLYFTTSGSLSRKMQVYLLLKGQNNHFAPPLKQIPYGVALQYKAHFPKKISGTLYLRIQDKQAPLLINPKLKNRSQMLQEARQIYPMQAFIIGGLLILSLYNFFYFLYLRDKGFLALSVFILSFIFEIGNHAGWLHYNAFLRENLQSIGSFFAFSLMTAGVFLVNDWLNLKTDLPDWYIRFHYLFWISFTFTICSLFIPYCSVPLSAIWGLIITILFILFAVSFYRNGLRLPWSMSLSALLFISSAIPPLLIGIGIMEDTPWLIMTTVLVLLLSLLLLSLTQAEQVKQKGKEAERIATTNKIKDEFLTTMSHELRTPMNAVVSASHLLELTTLSSEQKNYVSRLNTSSSHMLSLINNILDFARLNTSLLGLEKISFTLDTVVQTVKQLSQQSAENKHLTLQINQHFSLPDKQLQGDPTRLQQVLLNLLNNAIKFTSQGSVELSITPQCIDHDRATLLFEVIDTGIGLSKKQQTKLFKPFMQAENSISRQYGGSGLGLAISHKLVKRMGGNLAVESSLNQGSRFYFSLNFPLKKRASKQEKLDSTSKIPLPTEFLQAFRVLLVDDDEMNRFFGQKILKACGVKVFVAESGKDVLQQLEEKTFDLIFMDVSMPSMDGYETTRRLRSDQRFIHLPVVALTAHAIGGERERCLEAGMDDYLTKPFKMEQLNAMIHYWAEKSMLNKKE